VKRGDLITVAVSGDYGKPRPAVVIQSDSLEETDSVLVCLITSTLEKASHRRLDLAASDETGLRMPSQAMADKILTARRDRCGPVIGKVDATTMGALGRLLTLVMGLAD
jgi:mRNA interferase MazF